MRIRRNASIIVAAMLAFSAVSGQALAAPALSAPPTASATATALRPWTLNVGLYKGTVTMPSTLRAGTWVMHVNSTDAQAELQAVRPPSTLTRNGFVARWRAWWAAQNVSGTSAFTTWNAWRQSVTFVGGGVAVPHSIPGASRSPVGAGTFAITLRPGTYWFYGASTGDPVVGPSHIKVVTVVGTGPPQTLVPFVGTVRFGQYPATQSSVFLPASLPAQGYLRAIGTPGYVSTLWLQKLKPGVTITMLHTDGECFDAFAGGPPRQQCFEPYTYQLGGGVSAGASALWYYRVPVGSYAVGQRSHDAVWDADVGRPFVQGQVSLVAFS
ncbi:MAG: hypothetical protein ABIP19_12770 [Dermatophilaceae bacterium]